MLTRVLFGLALLGLWTAPAWAVTRYVDLTLPGSCSNGSTTYDPVTEACGSGSATIYNTVEGAVTPTVSGDIIYLRSGTYTTRITFSGKVFTSATTLSGYPGDVVTYAPIFTAGTPALTVVSWLVVQDMTMSGANGPDNETNNIKGFYVSGPDNWTFQRLTITGFHYSGIYFEHADNVTIQDNIIHTQVSTSCASGTRWYGIYFHNGNNAIIRRNQIYSNPGGGIQMYPGPISNAEISRNTIRDNNSCTSSDFPGGVIISRDSGGGAITGTKISDNLIHDNGSAASNGKAPGITLLGYVQNTDIYNNVVYNNRNDSVTANEGYGVVAVQYCTSCGNNGWADVVNVKNNIITANESTEVLLQSATNQSVTHNACTAAESCGSTGKVIITAITDCTVSTSDFTLKASSSCIGFGTSVSTRLPNGVTDIGAYEAPLIAFCSVEAATPTVVNITLTNNHAPPMLPATGVTGISARANTVAKINNGNAIRTGDNRIDQTVTVAFIAGQAIDISIAATNLTDSALIGNLTNQPFVQTVSNFSCTNNTAGAPAHVFTQAAFRFHSLRGTEAAPLGTPYATAPENSNILVRVGGSVRLRLAVTCTTADCPPTGFYPRYSRNAGAYTVIPNTFTADNIGFCGVGPDSDIPTNGTATTDQLSTAGTFVAGALVRTSNAIPTVDIALNGKTELEYCIAFDTDTTAGDSYDVRLYQQDGTALNAYTVTPRMTLAAERAGMGF